MYFNSMSEKPVVIDSLASLKPTSLIKTTFYQIVHGTFQSKECYSNNISLHTSIALIGADHLRKEIAHKLEKCQVR